MSTIGIDLGTTNSLVASWQSDRPILIANAYGAVLSPSVVGLDDRGELITGEAARERLLTDPALTIAAFKRYMGSSRRFELGQHVFLPEELASFVLRALKEDAEEQLGNPVQEAVITVPAYFNEVQRRATRHAAELAGLRVERLLNEPTAAALAHGLGLDGEGQFIVLDLGGGTFDVSIVEFFDGIMEVRSSAGDNALGGEDFTEVLVDHLLSEIAASDEQCAALRSIERPRLYAAAERAKRLLSCDREAEIRLELETGSHTVVLQRSEFERRAEPLLARIGDPVKRALRDSKVRVSELDAVVLVGGATRMPMVQKLCTSLLGRFPEHGIDPDQAVALGAAIQGALKDRDAALDEVVLTDICPFTLGVEVSRRRPDGSWRAGTFAPLIERNTTIPTSREDRFYTVEPNQERIQLVVYQGESIDTSENIRLGELDVPVPRSQREVEAVDVRFSYDVNGLLEVDATVMSTGAVHHLLILDNRANLTDEEIAASRTRLARLKIHPRDDQVNLALVHRGKRIYEQLLEEERAAVADALEQFQYALETQDERRIRHAFREFTSFLDRIET